MLWVDPEHHGKGFGADLILALVEKTGFVPARMDGGLGYSSAGFHAHRKAWLVAGQRALAAGKELHPELAEEMGIERAPAS